ncbi:phytoene desaturase family protein [Evansella clarkii]|uniref:phytoene desaturase family protein n=1 Tax=Evansella clarkii TaxID=79879 RepID=UPI0011171EAC|nr:FAD-dependent oxidoreductase [Evansella clarkii]
MKELKEVIFMAEKWDVVIVGGGLAGYVAANILCEKTNLSVLLLESRRKTGGRAITEKRNGSLFNLGPHALYKGGNAKPILEELGVKLSGKPPGTRGILLKGSTDYEAPFSLSGILKTTFLTWGERMEWVRVVSKLNNTDPKNLAEDQTFKHWVEQAAKSLKVRSLLYVLGRLATYCHAPDITSAKVMINHMKLAMRGVIYLDGGWQTIIDQLHNRAVISRVEVRTNIVVKKIKVNGGNDCFQVVLADGSEIFGNQVLFTGSPNELDRILNLTDANSPLSFFREIKPVKAATLDIALERLPQPARLFAMGIDEPFYYSVHSANAKLSESGQNTVLHVLKYFREEEEGHGEGIQDELYQFLEKVQPEWGNQLIEKRCLPRIIVNQRLPIAGDENRLELAEKMIIPGLYIAGDWASPDLILSEAAVSSAKKAALQMIQKRIG